MTRRTELLRDLARRRQPPDDLPPLAGTFLRGLSLGALIGAAMAGAAMLRRDRETAVRQPSAPAPDGHTETSAPGG